MANLNQSPSLQILLLPFSCATVCISRACSGVNNSDNPQTVTSVDEDEKVLLHLAHGERRIYCTKHCDKRYFGEI